MDSYSTLCRLVPADAHAYRGVRLAALRTDPAAFGASHADEAAFPLRTHADRLAANIVLGAFAGAGLVGIAGLRQGSGPRRAHKAAIWGFYVDPDHRRAGTGQALMTALIDAAPAQVEQLTLAAVADNAAAIAFYERMGFVRFGLEPKAIKTRHGYASEVSMVLFLAR